MDEFTLDAKPSPYIIRKMNAAIQFYQEYRTFDNKLPLGGGTWEQPVDWLRPLRCIIRAQADAERAKRAEEEGRATSPTSGGHQPIQGEFTSRR